jgi:hypothetical protein
MVPYLEYSGSRLISYEFGLVSDFSTNLPYSVPYYLKLTFKKGNKTMTDIWDAGTQAFSYLPYLNKIVDKKEGTLDQCTYYFTDDTVISIFND